MIRKQNRLALFNGMASADRHWPRTNWRLGLALCVAACGIIPLAEPSVADANLVAGDVVIIGMMGDAEDEIAWVPLVDLNTGTQVYFSNASYSATAGSFLGLGSQTSWLLRYDAPALISAGTILTFNDPGLATGLNLPANYTNFRSTQFGNRDVAGNGIVVGSTGDQIITFQSTDDPTLATFGNTNFTPLFAVDNNFPEFTYSGVGDFTGDLHPGLTNGVTALGVNDGAEELDNIRYKGNVVSGNRNTILAAIANDANWEGQNDQPATPLHWAAGLPLSGGAGFNITPIPEPSACLMFSVAATWAGVIACWPRAKNTLRGMVRSRLRA